MKTIKFSQKTKVLESYEVEYTKEEFELDCIHFEIQNFSYEELCDILLNNVRDVMIKVTEYFVDDYTGEYKCGPHFADAYVFFNGLLRDCAFDEGPYNSHIIEIYDQDFSAEEE